MKNSYALGSHGIYCLVTVLQIVRAVNQWAVGLGVQVTRLAASLEKAGHAGYAVEYVTTAYNTWRT